MVYVDLYDYSASPSDPDARKLFVGVANLAAAGPWEGIVVSAQQSGPGGALKDHPEVVSATRVRPKKSASEEH